MSDINCRMPVLALRDLVVMPEAVLQFDVSRKKSIAAVEAAMVKDQMLMLVAQKDVEIENPKEDDLYKIGTMAKVKQIVRMPKDTIRVLVEGKFPAELEEMISESPYLLADVIVHDFHDHVDDEAEAEAMCSILKEIIVKFEAAGRGITPELKKMMRDSNDIVHITNRLCAHVNMRFKDRQRLLEIYDFRERYDALCRQLNRELQVIQISQEIQQRVKAQVDKHQKDYVLREQLKAIQQELGEDLQSDIQEYEEAIKKLNAPDEVLEKLDKEIRRLKSMGANSAESSVLRNYIETLLEMPWLESGIDQDDISAAETVLKEDHYGLDHVKERMIEFLAVRILTKQADSPILCLVGPPGTGKTSIAKSIARAMNKAYVRISLGGVHDEAEIRGHRKTYIGAMPGRIATAIKQAGVNNPVMLLDEIDKVSTDYKGDTFSALLEVLDGEQNKNFRDNYLELPLDLSEVFFIATANSLSTIPRPLLDRMEVIEINSYTQNEKYHIAAEHLIKKQMKAHGLKEDQMTISKPALEKIIMNYTREAGVRNLERKIGDLCRKSAKIILQEKKNRVKITENNLEKMLGKPRFRFEMANETDEIGIVRGLAWTSVGGDTLSVEVNVMPGKGNVQLTGQMGDVMKESAATGVSYLRSVAKQYGIKPTFFEKNDIHIHIPEGAVPKDGPSAGITMATAMLSAITGIPVHADVAMTGEITLRGRVLPIGGLREKTIAAKIAGIRTVIVPEKNRLDIEELDSEIKKDMQFVYAKSMEDVLSVALVRFPVKGE